MPIRTDPRKRLLEAASKIAKAQTDGMKRMQEAQSMNSLMQGFGFIKSFLKDLGYITKETDPEFKASPAAQIQENDLRIIRAVPNALRGIQMTPGPRGERGKSVQGPPGPPGKDADIAELFSIASEESEMAINAHEKKHDHAMIHDPKMLGAYELDEPSLKEGDFLQVKGKKLVGVKMQMPDMNGMRNYVVQQGVSNVRSFSVTANTELDAMGMYVIDASSGNITITLPSALGRENHWFELVRIDSSNNMVTITPNGSETMSGMTTYQLVNQWSTLMLFAYNGNYLIRSV